MTSEATQKPIMVTGGSGFIASWIVKQLLDKGHTVHATVRSLARKEKYAHLEAIAEKAPGTLRLFEADLMKDGTFQEAMQGCGIVMHTASPFIVQGVKNPDEQLIKPALNGTRNVLNSVNATDTVERVVLTSSVVAIYGDNSEVVAKGGTINESMWNETSSVKNGPYAYSKTIAEKEAWKIAEAQDRWDMVVINPSFVMGPTLTQRSNSESITLMKQLMDGNFKSGVPELYFGIVDVRDVARAHLEAAFRPEAKGRHIVSNPNAITMLEMANAIREKYGNKFKLPKSQVPKFMLYLIGPFIGFNWHYVRNNVGVRVAFDNSKAQKELGINFTSPQNAVKAHAGGMVEAGMV